LARASIVVVVVFAIVLVAAGGLGVAGALARLDTSGVHARNDRLTRELAGLVHRERARAGELKTVVGVAECGVRSLDAFIAAVQVQVDSSNHAASVLNHVADLFNAGDKEDAVAVLQGDAIVSVADLDAATNGVMLALGVVVRDISSLERVPRA
jgi:hypothetical protein